jgi:flagellar assembly protein FliH
MAKAVFRPSEVLISDGKVILAPPGDFIPEHEDPDKDRFDELEEIDEYKGPTADDLRREAENFKAQWEIEKESMIASTRAEADTIISDAREQAKTEADSIAAEISVVKADAEAEAAKIIEEAKQQAVGIAEEAKSAFENDRQEAKDSGYQEGHEAGFNEGKAEVDRLIERTRVVLERAQDKREEILVETEQEIIDLVLLISRKVIKNISENQRTVVINNVIQALRKVKGRGNIIIRVNLADVKLTTEHTKDFIQIFEGTRTIQIQEDSTVDSGGCVIETDFGEIDARIASQLAELETKILAASPITGKAKAPASTARPAPDEVPPDPASP